jgi:hypothetical protein
MRSSSRKQDCNLASSRFSERNPRLTHLCVTVVNPEALRHLRSEERERLHHKAVHAALYYQGLMPLDGDWLEPSVPAPEHMNPVTELELLEGVFPRQRPDREPLAFPRAPLQLDPQPVTEAAEPAAEPGMPASSPCRRRPRRTDLRKRGLRQHPGAVSAGSQRTLFLGGILPAWDRALASRAVPSRPSWHRPPRANALEGVDAECHSKSVQNQSDI